MFKRNVRVKANIKKKIYFLFSMLLLTVVFTGTVFAAEQIFSPGDVNADGTVNLKDVTLLQRYFANTEEVILTTPENADVNADGEKNLKDVTVLQRYAAGGWGIELPEPAPIPGEETPDEDLKEYPILETKESAEGITSFSVQYGKSELERDLVCWSIHPENYEKTILLNFEIHGWEDSYAGDGQLLVNWEMLLWSTIHRVKICRTADC